MDITAIIIAVGALFAIAFGFMLVKSILKLRRVVPPTEVHIVQSEKSGRLTYGARKEGEDQVKATTYYAWPTWIPQLGVQVSTLPLTVFDQNLRDYDAYDKERVPFMIDVMAFYRIADPHLAAERIANMAELKTQLMASLQGAIRKILAEFTVEEIMQGRSEFGKKFTAEVDDDLKAWGVQTVKSVELMDIRDAKGHNVIGSIMAKRISGIDRESREKVAENQRAAKEAEIQASRQVELQQLEAKQQVGIRDAEVTKQVGISKQKSEQEVAAAEQNTIKAQMEVKREAAERQAEIDRNVANITAKREKEVAEVTAERDKNVSVTNANAQKEVQVTRATAEAEVLKRTSEGEKIKLTNIAEGQLKVALNNAEGIRAEGEARGKALEAEKMAPVNAELALQSGIGANQQYQTYMVNMRTVAANEEIGKAQAGALTHADVKIIVTTGDTQSGLKSVGDVFTPKGGLQVASMLEGLKSSPMGAELLAKFGLGGHAANTTHVDVEA
jgi:flotillin